MFVHYRTQGLVFKKEDRGEADRLFTVYTKEFGKLEILGKSIRKISSKLRAGMELFSLSEIEFIQGRTFKTLTDAILNEEFENLNKNLEVLKTASRISYLSDELMTRPENDEKIWELLIKTFQRLNHCSRAGNSCPKVYYYFFWNFVSVLGYQPELYKCLDCRKKIVLGKNYFNSEQGGIICGNCLKGGEKNKEIDSDAIKTLRLIIKRNWKILSKIKFKPEELKVLENISNDYFLHILRMIK